jgi:WD40 repeat protein
VPAWLSAIIERLHAKDPAERFQSAAEVAERLANGLAHVQDPAVVPAPKLTATVRGLPSTRRGWLIPVVAVLLLAGTALTAAYLLEWIGTQHQPAGKNGPERAADAPVQVRLRTSLKGHTGAVHCLAFDKDGKMLASGGGHGDHTVRLWDVADQKELATLEGHSGPVMCVAFSPNSKILASAAWDGTVRLWQVDTRSQID